MPLGRSSTAEATPGAGGLPQGLLRHGNHDGIRAGWQVRLV